MKNRRPVAGTIVEVLLVAILGGLVTRLIEMLWPPVVRGTGATTTGLAAPSLWVGCGAALFVVCYVLYRVFGKKESLKYLFACVWADHNRVIFNGKHEPQCHIIGVGKYAFEKRKGRNENLPEARVRPNWSDKDDKEAQKSEWTTTYSVLDHGQLQDLLHDDVYLHHFAKGRRRSDKETRLLVLDNKFGDEIVIRSYLGLSNALGIDTFLVTKREYDKFLGSISDVLSERAISDSVRKIMRGQPELSLVGSFDTAVKAKQQEQKQKQGGDAKPAPISLLLRDEWNLNPGITNNDRAGYTVKEFAAINMFLESIGSWKGNPVCEDDHFRLFEKRSDKLSTDGLKRLRDKGTAPNMDLLHPAWLIAEWKRTKKKLGV